MGRSVGSKLGGAIKGGLVSGAKAGAAAIAAASGAVSLLTKQAVAGFADYEQLVGGVETLFKGSADQVQQYAAEAFRTAGLSANEYMETVTSFSASLLQSLGGDTKAAADLADQAIIDMSDNANKMGSDMASIQNAYQGFAKQNFSMLDNLKLGYGGTQEEMYRLMSDAAALNKEFAKSAEFSLDEKGHLTAGYADIIRAIHIVQTEMGITGTTAQEAAETISGSISMMKSSWKNLLTGLANPETDLGKLVDSLVESTGTVMDNIGPAIEHALAGISQLVEKAVPVISEKLPVLAEKLLPPLITTAGTIVTGLAKALPSILQTVVLALPPLVQELGAALVAAAPALAEAGKKLLSVMVNGLKTALPKLADAALEMIQKFSDFVLNNAADAGGKWGQTVVGIIKAMAQFLIKAIPILAEAAVKIVAGLAMFLVSEYAELLKAGAALVGKVGEGIKTALHDAVQWGRDLIGNFIQGIKDKLGELWQAIKDVAGGIKDLLGFSEPKLGPLSDFHTYAPDMMKLYAQGIRDNAHLPLEEIKRSFNLKRAGILDGVSASPTIELAPAFRRTPATEVVGLIQKERLSGGRYYDPIASSDNLILVELRDIQARSLTALEKIAANIGNTPQTADRASIRKMIFDLYNEEKRRMGSSLTAQW